MGNKLRRHKKCVGCMIFINKSANRNPYLCRDCEKELKKMDVGVPLIYNSFYS
tara:strand:+ start:648 stop:806 length:159 start_codon:yes stop_codon:yes gene_type:complete